MKVAFMFPGQGSQYVGMGRSLYTESSGVKDMFDKADELLGYKLSEIIFSGSLPILSHTDNTQPALLLVCSALFSYLKPHLRTKYYAVIGHSLGEYSAYVASGRLSFEEGLSLVRQRGLLMAFSEEERLSPQYGMAAVLKLSQSVLSEIVNKHGLGEVFIANDNCPGQIVISGLKSTLTYLSPFIEEAGGRSIALDVSGAFHSPYMKEAADKFSKVLENVSFSKSSIPLYSNLSALPLKEGEEKESLAQQIIKPVRFRESIENMISKEKITHFIEVGPGKVLQGLVKKINTEVKVLGFSDISDLETLMEAGI